MDAYVSSSSQDHTVITIRGEVDLANAEHLQQRLILLAHPATGQITLDLSLVTFMYCSGLRALISLARHSRARGGKVFSRAASPEVARLFDLVGALAEIPLSPLPAPAVPRRLRRGVRRCTPNRPMYAPGSAESFASTAKPSPALTPQPDESILADATSLAGATHRTKP